MKPFKFTNCGKMPWLILWKCCFTESCNGNPGYYHRGDFISLFVPKEGVSLVFSAVHQATSVFKLLCYPHLRGSKYIAGHFCAPESVRWHSGPFLGLKFVRSPSERIEHQGEISFSKHTLAPIISSLENDPVVVKETDLGGKH